MKTWAQICKNFYIGCLKTQLHFVKIKNNFVFFKLIFFSSIRAGRVRIGQGASQYGQGAAPSEIGLAGTLLMNVGKLQQSNDAIHVASACNKIVGRLCTNLPTGAQTKSVKTNSSWQI